MILIPVETNGKAYVTLSCNVGEVSVAMRFLWNERDGHWFCDFESVNGANNGVRLVANSRLLRGKNRVCNGDFVVLKSDIDGEGLGFNNLGKGYELYYLGESDFEHFEGLL